MQKEPNLNDDNEKQNGSDDQECKKTERDYALDALQRILQLKSRVVLPYLVPHLTQPPVDVKALASLTLVAGDALSRHLSRIIQAVVTNIAEEKDSQVKDQQIYYAQQLITSVEENYLFLNFLLFLNYEYVVGQRFGWHTSSHT